MNVPFGQCLSSALGLLRVTSLSHPCPSTWIRNLGPQSLSVPVRHYAARKGTRARKEKAIKKNKAKEEKKEEIPAHLRKRMAKSLLAGKVVVKVPDDSRKQIPTDNVYPVRYYRWPVFSVKEAVNGFRESHHPTMFDISTSNIKAYFALDLSTKKQTQFVEHVSGVVLPPHLFSTGPPRSVCALCATKEQVAQALAAGATAAFGVEAVKMFQEGALDDEDYEYVCAHADIVGQLSPIRGILLHKFPIAKRGTVGFDVVSMVKQFREGIKYQVQQDISNKAVGALEAFIGKVDMSAEQVEENFVALVKDLLQFKPKNTDNPFLVRALLSCENTSEQFMINLEPYTTKPTISAPLREKDSNSQNDMNQAIAVA